MAVKSSQQKMREIEYAAIALISREGINAASFRKVAAASGYSLGSVQNFFPSQQELFLGIMDYIVSAERQWASESGLFEGGMRAEDFFLYSEQMLPFHEERMHELRAWDALVRLGSVDDSIKKKAEDLLSENYEIMETVFEFMKADGIFRKDLNTSYTAGIYYTFLEGLGRHAMILGRKYSEEKMKKIVREFVQNNFMEKSR